MARLAVPDLADWCIVYMLEEGGQIRRLAVEHADPTKHDVARAIADAHRIDPGATSGVPRVLRTGRPEFHPDATAALLTADVHDPAGLKALVDPLGVTSWMCVPLSARGRTFGAISFISTGSDRRYGRADLALAEELAHHAALAVDNARLFVEARGAESRFRELVDSVDAVVWEADPTTLEFSFVSRRAEELLGHPVDLWLKEPDFWVRVLHPDDRSAALARRRAAAESGEDHELEYRVVSADGRVVWVRDLAHALRDEEGETRLLRGLMMDVTDRKRAERLQRVTHTAMRALAEAPSLGEAAPQILRAVCEGLDWEVGGLWEFDREADRLRCLAFWQAPAGSFAEFEGISRSAAFPPGVGLPGRVWASGKPAWIPDVTRAQNFPRAPVAARVGLHGAFGFPLISAGEVIGVMEFFSREIREPDEQLLGMMGAVGTQVGQMIARKRVEEEVRFQKTLLESQSEATIDGLLVVSPKGTMLSFNRRFLQMWDIPDDVIESRSDAAALESVLDKVVNPEEFLTRVAYLYDHPDERSREEIELRDGRIFDRWSAPLRGEGGTYYGRAWYFRDVTELKRAEEVMRENTRRAELLAEAATLFSASLNDSVVLKGLTELMVRSLADYAIADVVQADGSLHRSAVAHHDPEQRQRMERLRDYPPDPDGAHPVLEVLRTGRSRTFPTVPDTVLQGAARDQEHLRLLRELRPTSAIILPLVARGRTFGAITLASTDPGRSYGRSDVELAEDLARRAALAVDNARLYGERSYVARTLQESLLPPRLPEVPGIEMAARYLPAGETEVGGDFYDIFPTAAGGWGIVIGDVCGKGVEAARLTGLARYTTRAAAMQTTDPLDVLSTLNRAILEQNGDAQFCTVAYAAVETREEGARLIVSCAGHPLPLKLSTDGTVQPVGRPGTVLGLFDDPSVHAERVPLAPGDMLLLYTDGVTEARGPAGVFGDERLRELLRTSRSLSPSEIAERIERSVRGFQSGATPRDDIALLVIQVSPERRPPY